MDYLLNFSPWQQALFATLFTWGVTALGSALVFAFKTIRSHALALMYGFAAGVMIAASFWSLLDPAINLAEQQDRIPWLVVGIGFVGGGFFLYLADKIIPSIYLKHAKPRAVPEQPSNGRSCWSSRLHCTIFLKDWRSVLRLGPSEPHQMVNRRQCYWRPPRLRSALACKTFQKGQPSRSPCVKVAWVDFGHLCTARWVGPWSQLPVF